MKSITRAILGRARAAAVVLFGLLATPTIAQTVEYLHPDALGSPIAATNEAGATIWTKKYSAYGAEVGGTGTSSIGLGFTGGLNDPDQGLVLLHNRYYDPQVGRFISVDPVGYVDGDVQSFNRYSYAANNPFRFRDENGAWAEDAVIATASIAIGAYSLGENVRQGNYWWAAVDLLGIVHDAVAYAIPFYPGAAGLAIQGVRRLPGAGMAVAQGTKRGTVTVIEMSAREAAPAAGDVASLLSRVCCFVAGTPVATAQGETAIEDIKLGDLVLSKSESTGEISLKPVVGIIPGHDRQIWQVTFTINENGRKAVEVIETTNDHPWRSTDGTWTATEQLVPGATVLRASGAPAQVARVQQTQKVVPTFNLEVGEFHTYFVGASRLWVHNSCTGLWRSSELSALKLEHIFSADHLQKGIMLLGETKEAIIGKARDVVLAADKLGELRNGINTIRTKMNGHDATIRVYFEDGVLKSFDIFKGLSNRPGRIIDMR